MTKEVMKQALEAFEAIMMVRDIDSATTIAKNARYGLREAINQDQSEQLARLGWQEIDCPICGGGARAFPKQEQGEPVAWRAPNWGHDNDTRPWSYRDHDEPFYPSEVGEPLYTTPQQRKPLTDERIADIVREVSHGSAIRRDGSTSMRIARAIESAHGIKE